MSTPRKTLPAALLLALVLSLLAACGGANTGTGTGGAATTTAPDTGANATTVPAATTVGTTEPEGATTPMATTGTTTEATPAAGTTAPTTGTAMGSVMLPEVDPAAVTGNVVIAGSSTVYPLTQAIAERFTDEGYAGQITIDSIGTGGGFERFCTAGDSDIVNASRPINDEERAACQALNPAREPIEFRVGTDALAVVVSSENDFLTDITIEDLGRIFSGEVTSWNELNPSYPAETIQLFSPGTDSGTYDYFVEEVLGEDETGIQQSGAQFSENDNVLVQGVEGSPYAIGYFGYAYFVENQGNLKALTLGGIEPNEQTAESGEYPLARPLFIYSDANIMQEKPQVAQFINFYLTNVNDEISGVGYFPASTTALDEARQMFLDNAPSL
jgi:phosphate binding protein